jgi:glycosyltransferase involved in cell wall biosynthesis
VDVTLVVDALGPQLSGIGRYVWELCRRVPLELSIEHTSYFADGDFITDPQFLVDGKAERRLARMPRWLRSRALCRRLKNGIVHGPNYFLPPGVGTGVLTAHDLSVFRFPETHPAERLRAFERDFENSLRRATHIITDTETVRREVMAEFGLGADQVSAVALGVGPEFRPREAAEIEAQLALLDLSPGSYALCVSTFEPRKKIAELIRAWSELPSPLRTATPLVLAGAKGWLNDDVHELIRSGAREGWLKHLGFVPEPALPALYAGACLFLYPSIYEGFGLPPLEAMASGVPVLVSNASCLPEVCGEAAGYVEPDDVDGFGAAIADALGNPQWRADARSKGLERAPRFSWETCVKETVAIYGRFQG